MTGPFVVVHQKLFNKGMVISLVDGNKPCPQGVLFLTIKDSPTLFDTMEQAQSAVERTVLWGEKQNYMYDYRDYVIMPITLYEELQSRATRGFKKKPK